MRAAARHQLAQQTLTRFGKFRVDCVGDSLTASSRFLSASVDTASQSPLSLALTLTEASRPITPTPRHQHDRGGGPGLRRHTHHRQGDDGPRAAQETLPRHRGRAPQRGIPPASGRTSPYGRHPTVGAQSRLLQHLGDAHWREPCENVTRHQAAATVIGRRAQGFTARRRKGVTHPRPQDRAVRATNQTGPDSPPATTGHRHRSRTPGTTSDAPNRTRTRDPGRATITPATANNGQLQT
jgi:hypothetical protein